jgi:hypothetical protein
LTQVVDQQVAYDACLCVVLHHSITTLPHHQQPPPPFRNCFASNNMESLSALTVPVLRQRLKDLGLVSTGLKAALVDRLTAALESQAQEPEAEAQQVEPEASVESDASTKEESRSDATQPTAVAADVDSDAAENKQEQQQLEQQLEQQQATAEQQQQATTEQQAAQVTSSSEDSSESMMAIDSSTAVGESSDHGDEAVCVINQP